MRFEILGPIRVICQGREVLVTAGRERALLAVLLLNANRTVPMSRLVDALWPGGTLRNARSLLHGCVSRLRKHLAHGGIPEHVIVTDTAGYRAEVTGTTVDLLEFRDLVNEARACARDGDHHQARNRYRVALELWRGPALAGIDSQPVQHSAARLDEERIQALEECARVELALGSDGALVGELTELVREHPYREGLHEVLMLALYRAGRQADALSAYQRVRRTLVTELGQEPGPALRDLQQRILAVDDTLRPDEPAPPTHAAESPPASHSLPRTLDDFTGRDPDLAWLVEAVSQPDPYAPLVLAVDGMPGIGKTSLAVRVAHLLKPGFPDGQLFIDLHGHSEHRPVEPATALGVLLRQLGVPQTRIGTELDDRVAQWRAELAGRRALVVLDNAANSDQVTPLLPADPGCLALVTSRRRLVDLDAARPRSVDTLEPDDAVTLLERVAGQRVRDEPDAAAEVAKRCGYLPLALRLAAARLAHRPGWRVRDLADRLSDPGTPLAELTAGDRTVTDAFALSYKHLTPAAQRVFRLLGLHPGEHFDVRAAAALAGVGLADAQRVLDELVDAHLVQELRANRYRVHDLLKSYAGELAAAVEPESGRETAIEGLLDYYLHAAAAASAHLETATSMRNFHVGEASRQDLISEQHAQEADWLEIERSNLTAAVRSAATGGRHRYTWQITRAMWQFLQRQGYVDDLIDTHLRGLAAAQHLGDRSAAASMHNYLAWAYARVGNRDKAIESAQQTLLERQRLDDRIGVAIARRNLATVYAESGRHAEAAVECEYALTAARRANDLEVLATTVANAGHIYMTMRRDRIALHYSRHGLLLARQVGDNYLAILALRNVGLIRARLGEAEAALRILLTTLKARQRISSKYGEAETRNGLAAVYRARGDFERAVFHHQQALLTMRNAGFRQGECAVRNEFGRTLLAAGDRAGALEQHRLALDGAVTIKHKYAQAQALDGLAACLRDTDPETARRHWRRALQLYQELDMPERHEVKQALTALTTA